jgi:GntR family transcriptional repressor for pyruvate dehydrogenase complex
MSMLAAMHRTDKDLEEIEKALLAHKSKIESGKDAMGEDFLFHLKIADASKNSVMKSLSLIITPDIMHYFKEHDVCGEGRAAVAVQQHEELLQYISEKNPEKAGECLKLHLSEISAYVNTLENDLVFKPNNSLV